MYVEVERGASVLREREDFTRLHVQVPPRTGADALNVALKCSGAGFGEGAHARLMTQWLIDAADVDASWLRSFENMLDFAETKGWLSDDRSTISAHIEFA